jgi:hypothetical protein
MATPAKRKKTYKVVKPGEKLPEETPTVKEETEENPLLETIPNAWDISEAASTPVLFFSRDDKTLATVPLDLDLLTQLVPALNSLFIAPEDAPTTWVIRYPEGSDNHEPLLSLLRGGKIVATIPLSQDFLKEIVPILKKLYNEPVVIRVPFLQRLWKWVKTHKFVSIVGVIVLIPVISGLLVGLYTFISASF